MRRRLFTYWEGPEHPYISHCLDTIKKNAGVPVTVLRPETVDNYVGDVLHPNWKRLTQIAQKADTIRLAVMYNNGGLWCDADTLFLKSCKHLFKDGVDFVGLRWLHNSNMTNGYWFCKKKSKFIKACLDDVNLNLKNKFKEYYDSGSGCYLGEDLFARVESLGKYPVKTYSLDTFIPVNFPVSQAIWQRNDDIDEYLGGQNVAIGLNNSQFSEEVRISDVETLAKRRTLFASALRKSGVDVTVVSKILPKSADLASVGLPEDFGPGHEDWNMLSKRQKYYMVMDGLDSKAIGDKVISTPTNQVENIDEKKLLSQRRRELSKLDFGGSLAVMTIFSGETYQWFAPMFARMINKNIPDADVLMYCHGPCTLPERYRSDVITKGVINLIPVDGYRTAALRFLYSDKTIESYDYVLITDVDMMITKETDSIVSQHVRSMMLWDTDCYDNYNHGTGKDIILPGVHFVAKSWWDKTLAVRSRELADLRLKTTNVYDGYDEKMLGRIVEGSGLKLPTMEQQMWNHHGLHMGEFRKTGLHHMVRKGMSPVESNAVHDMLSDDIFMEMVAEASKVMPDLTKAFNYFKSI